MSRYPNSNYNPTKTSGGTWYVDTRAPHKEQSGRMLKVKLEAF